MTQKIPSHVSVLVAKIVAEQPLHKGFITASVAGLKEDELALLEDHLSFCIRDGITLDYLAESYLISVMDSLREQVYFAKHKKYRYSSFAEVAGDVYFNKTYMGHYMHALLLTLFFWPNHREMFRFLKNTIPKDKPGKYLEIGPGHGYFISTAIETTSYGGFLGVDISETSIAQTKRLMDHRLSGRPHKDFELKCIDFLSADLPENGFDAIVMGEVLEHVERPDLFMKQICRLAKKDAYIFVTTCIDAAAVDHIYLFESTRQLSDLFDACGLSIVESLVLPYEGKTLEESAAERLPVNVAYVLKRK